MSDDDNFAQETGYLLRLHAVAVSGMCDKVVALKGHWTTF